MNGALSTTDLVADWGDETLESLGLSGYFKGKHRHGMEREECLPTSSKPLGLAMPKDLFWDI